MSGQPKHRIIHVSVFRKADFRTSCQCEHFLFCRFRGKQNKHPLVSIRITHKKGSPDKRFRHPFTLLKVALILFVL